jgi:oxalate decarboxylase/phosphoglucose isomerase-like protein (cupin superfamily)
MHDETFLVTSGKMSFHLLSGRTITASQGDYVTVPTRSPHTFSNPYDEEAKFFNTYTPAHYINYFKMLATMAERGKPMDPEVNRRAMAVSKVLIWFVLEVLWFVCGDGGGNGRG